MLPVFDAEEAYWREMARLLFVAWAARTGRTLPHVPVSHLSRRQLEDFWADDELPASQIDARESDMHTSLAAVDIVGFGARHRDGGLRRRLRQVMYDKISDALRITGPSLSDCYLEDRGDGALIVFPAEVDPALLLDPLAHHLTAALRRENRYADPGARLRLRLAVHHGHVVRDAHGVAGDTVLELFRLLDARSFKQLLDRHSDAEMGLIVPDRLFTETARQGGPITPEAYRELRIVNKGMRLNAHVWMPPVLQPRKTA